MIAARHIGATVSTDGVQSGGMFAFALGALFVAFIVFITAKGELAKYIGFFLITPPATSGTAAPTTGSTTAPVGGSTTAVPTVGGIPSGGAVGVGATPAD